ncbi:hypothetical protein TIFTF001_020502 [Ficus carica]|uniref:Uncharacterized protein n=1 Tax=Ficus carica TaxID=3494 RepID=A0AA88ARN4_FICCA|nr:hypothetical protein TIFTF001_020502 [Ficus carica]
MPPTPRPSTSTSRGRRPPSTLPTVTGCHVDGAGVRKGARTICNLLVANLKSQAGGGEGRRLEWTVPELGGARTIYNLLVVDLKSRARGGKVGLRGRRRSLKGAWTICNRELEGAEGARTVWKDGAVMWVGWPEMQRPAQQRRTAFGDLFCLLRRPEN